MLEIVAVPVFTDNYIWLVHDEESGETAVVDPGDAAPALAEAERRGWASPRSGTPTGTPTTPAETCDQGGHRRCGSGPAAETIAGRDVALSEGE